MNIFRCQNLSGNTKPLLPNFLVSGLLLGFAVLPLTASAAPLSPPADNLKLWVAADGSGFKDGDPVATWPDLSGHGNDLTSAGTDCPRYLTDGPGGRPTVVFKGDNTAKPMVNTVMNVPIADEWPQITWVFAGRNFHGPLLSANQNGSLFCPGDRGFWLLNQDVKIGPAPVPDTDPSKAEVFTVTAGYDSQGVMHLTSYLDGKLLDSAQSADDPNGIVLAKATLGSSNPAGYGPYNGDISEVLVYRDALTASRRAAAEHYLMVKYGVTPPGPGETVAPAVPRVLPTPQVVRATNFGKPSLTGLQLWARPEDLPAQKDAPITQWHDASGHGNDLTCDSAVIPTVKLDGIGGWPTAVLGEGQQTRDAHSYLKIPISGPVQHFSLIVVGTGMLGGNLLDTAPQSRNTLRGGGNVIQFCGAPLAYGGPFQPLLDYIVERQAVEVDADISKADGSLWSYTNGVLQKSQTVTGNKVDVPLLFQDARLGDTNRGDGYFKGQISEILLYDHVLSAEERAQTTNYLTRKYGLITVSPEQSHQARSIFSLTVPHFTTRQSWLGNSFPNHDQTASDWVQSGMFDILTQPDGTVLASSVYDEAGKEIGWYKDGRPVPRTISVGTGAMASDGQYLYLGASGMSKTRTGLRRYLLDGTEAPWPGIKAGDAVWFNTDKPWQEASGMAVVGNHIFMGIAGQNQLQILDKTNGTVTGTVPTPAQPGRLLTGANGTLWVALPDSVVQMRTDGSLTGAKITGIKPGGLALNPSGQLLVGDTGTRQQIITYDISGPAPREVSAIGVKGGAWAPPTPGQIGPDRFFNPKSLGTDAAGNIYVLNDGQLIRALSPQGKELWHLEDSCFCVVGDFDPTSDGNDYYSAYGHYTYRPNQPPGRDWEWTGLTYDDARFPEMSHSRTNFFLVRRINGHLLRYAETGGVEVSRQEPGSEIFIPCAKYVKDEGKHGDSEPKAAPAEGRYIWTDLNGDGKLTADEVTPAPAGARRGEPSYEVYVDSKGGLWDPEVRLGIRYTPLKGITPQGAPIYDFADQQWMTRPAEFVEVLRCQYFPATDTMILAGNTWDHPSTRKETWGGCGREAIRYDDWSKPTRHVVCRMPFPDNAWTLMSMAVSMSTHRLFVGETGTAAVFVYDTNTGNLLGCMEPNLDILGPVGWIDQSGGVRCFTRANHDTVVVVEDSYGEKAVVYTLPENSPVSMNTR